MVEPNTHYDLSMGVGAALPDTPMKSNNAKNIDDECKNSTKKITVIYTTNGRALIITGGHSGSSMMTQNKATQLIITSIINSQFIHEYVL